MPRRNRPAKGKRNRPTISARHLAYNPDELSPHSPTTIVRYMGETDGDYLKCFHPEGFEFWPHVSQVWVPKRKVTA